MFRRLSLGIAQITLLLFITLEAAVPGVWAQADVQGQWSTLNYTMTINPIHVALMHNGKILVTTGSGNCPASQAGCPSGPPYGGSNHSGAVILDPVAKSITQLPVGWDMFCNGMTVLPDGRVFVNGGTLAYDPFKGLQRSSIFDPATNTFTDVQNMAHGRWYPTVITLGDGRVLTFSGFNETTGATNTTVEFYTVGSGWSQQNAAPWTPPLYPRLHLLPNGKVFASASQPSSHMFNPSTATWTLNVASTNYGGMRTYGSSVLLPLTPANNYNPVVMILGGNDPATATTELIDLGASSPDWVWGPDMSQPRIEMDAVILPTGKVLAVGGSASDENAATASRNADLYDPASNSFSSAGANAFPRLYHTVALLLPDATVWLAGSNPARGTYESRMEIYQPAYLFTRDTNNNVVAATRPTIANAPSHIAWGGSFTVSTPDAANISQAVLVRPGSSTHAFDVDQRLVGMTFTAGSGTLTVTAPPNSNIAPPGYYMLFLINNQGVPSVASFVLLNGSSSAPAPTVTSVSPDSGSAGGGTGVTITGTNFVSGATVSFGGTAATSVTVVNSTSITATTPSHAAGGVTVVVTNSDTQSGSLSNGFTYNPPAPTVSSVSPNSGTVSGGTVVTITGTNFLTGATVSFGGTAATSVTVMSSASISATTPAHAAGAVNLVVANPDTQNDTLVNGYTFSNPAPPDFTIAVTALSPATIAPGGSATATVTISPVNGFNGTVTLACSIAPAVTPAPTCSFAPSSVTGSGTSTLTVRTTAATHASLAPRSGGVLYGMWLPIGGLVMLGAGLTSRRKKFLCSLIGCLLFSGLMILAGCGGGGGSSSGGGGGSGSTGTPAGSYTITISAVGAVTHTTPVTVSVN